MGAKVAQNIVEKMERNPREYLNVIVLVEGDLDRRAIECEEMGFEVRHKLKLIDSLAMCGSGMKVVKLTTEDWVISIQEDKQVSTL